MWYFNDIDDKNYLINLDNIPEIVCWLNPPCYEIRIRHYSEEYHVVYCSRSSETALNFLKILTKEFKKDKQIIYASEIYKKMKGREN